MNGKPTFYTVMEQIDSNVPHRIDDPAHSFDSAARLLEARREYWLTLQYAESRTERGYRFTGSGLTIDLFIVKSE